MDDVEVGRAEDLARALAAGGDPLGAAQALAALWQGTAPSHGDETLDRWRGVRRSFWLSHMVAQARASDAARAELAALCDPAEQALATSAPLHLEDAVDAVVLSSALGDDERVVTWLPALRTRPLWDELVGLCGDQLLDALVSEGRWVAAGQLFADPGRQASERCRYHRLRSAAAGPAAALGAALQEDPLAPRTDSDEGEQLAKAMQADAATDLRGELASLYGACLAAARDDAASRVAHHLLETLDDAPTRLALVRAAQRAGHARAAQRSWLDAACSVESPPDAEPLREWLAQELG